MSEYNKFIPAIKQPLVESRKVMEVIAKEMGAIWGIDEDYDEPVLP